MLGGAALGAGRVHLARASGYLLQPSQPVIHGGLGKLHPTGELAQVQLRVLAPPARHLLKGGGQRREHAARFQRVDGRRLPEACPDRLADVGRLEVETAIHDPADRPHHANVLELHHGAARAHHRKQTRDPVAVLYVDNTLAGRSVTPAFTPEPSTRWTIADAHEAVGATNSRW